MTSRKASSGIAARVFALMAMLTAFGAQAAVTSPPTISGFWPGDAPSGALVFVFGANFDTAIHGTSVAVNNVSAPMVQVLDSALLVFMLPSGDTAGPISVTTAAGTATSTKKFGPDPALVAINGFWPSAGSPGTIVFVFGKGFVPGSTQVSLNNQRQYIMQVLDSGLLLFMVSADASTGTIAVNAPAGTMATVDPFTVMSPNAVVPEGVTASRITTTMATVSWITGVPATSQVEYGKTASYGLLTTLDGTLIMSHSQLLTGLTPVTLYHYRVISKDSFGNIKVSADATFTTPSSDPVVVYNDTTFAVENSYSCLTGCHASNTALVNGYSASRMTHFMVKCNTCHGTHTAAEVGLPKPDLTGYYSGIGATGYVVGKDRCLTCHSAVLSKKGHPNNPSECISCHAPHVFSAR